MSHDITKWVRDLISALNFTGGIELLMMMTSQKRKNIYINVSFFKSLRGEANQGGRKQIFYGGATVNSKKWIFKKFPKFTK